MSAGSTPTEKSKCPACSQNAFDASIGSCSNCGYTAGESNRCPHCGAIARIEGSGVKAVCGVCGGPRIVANFGGFKATTALKEQKKLLSKARLASVSTVLQGMFAAIATLIGLAVFSATSLSIVGNVIMFAVAAIPLFLAMRSRSKAKTAREGANEAGERAWQAAAEDVASHAKKGITVAALSQKLGIEPAHAEKLLTQLAVHDRTRIDVGDDAEVVYSVHPDAPVDVEGGVRVSDQVSGAIDSEEEKLKKAIDEAAAAHELQQEEEQQAQAAAKKQSS